MTSAASSLPPPDADTPMQHNEQWEAAGQDSSPDVEMPNEKNPIRLFTQIISTPKTPHQGAYSKSKGHSRKKATQ